MRTPFSSHFFPGSFRRGLRQKAQARSEELKSLSSVSRPSSSFFRRSHPKPNTSRDAFHRTPVGETATATGPSHTPVSTPSAQAENHPRAKPDLHQRCPRQTTGCDSYHLVDTLSPSSCNVLTLATHIFRCVCMERYLLLLLLLLLLLPRMSCYTGSRGCSPSLCKC